MANRTVQLNLPACPLETVQKLDRSGSVRSWVDLVRAALRRAGLSQKEAAYRMGISEKQLSNQLRYDEPEHFSLWRAHRLGPEFWREFIDLGADLWECGPTSPERVTDAELGRAMRIALRGQR